MSLQSEHFVTDESVSSQTKTKPLSDQGEVADNHSEKPKKLSLRKKIWAALIGVPSVALSMGLGSYYYVHRQPVAQGVSIHQLITHLYEYHDPKVSFMKMIEDSSFDQTTKSFLIAVANDYKDIVEIYGGDGVSEQIAAGKLTPPTTLNDIMTTEDPVSRRNKIIAESNRIRTIEKIIEIVQSDEVKNKIQKIEDSQSSQMTIDEVQNQGYLGWTSEERLEQVYQDFGQHMAELPTSIQDKLFKYLSQLLDSTYTINGETRSLSNDELVDIVNTIVDYNQQHGPQQTVFLLNAIQFDFTIELDFLMENRQHALVKLTQLFETMKTFDQAGLAFFSGSEHMAVEYIGSYGTILNSFFQTNDDIKFPDVIDPIFFDVSLGDKQLASLLFFDYYISAYLGQDGEKFLQKNTPDDFFNNSNIFDLIHKYDLTAQQMRYFFNIFGGLTFGLNEDYVKLVNENPYLLYRANNRFYYLGLIEQNNLNIEIYKQLSKQYPQLPSTLTPFSMMSLESLNAEIYKLVGTIFTAEDLSKMLETEVKNIDGFMITPVEQDFSVDVAENKTRKAVVQIPLIFRGIGDNFIAFDEEKESLAYSLLELNFQQLIDQLKGFHFLYVQDGQMKFGSIARELDKITSLDHQTEDIFPALRKLGITKLLRTLPVSWNGDDINLEGHAVRISSEQFTGILVVTDQAQQVTRQYLISVPSYEMQNLNKPKLSEFAEIKTGEQIEFLLPDAGFRAIINSNGFSSILSGGQISGADQMVSFFPRDIK